MGIAMFAGVSEALIPYTLAEPKVLRRNLSDVHENSTILKACGVGLWPAAFFTSLLRSTRANLVLSLPSLQQLGFFRRIELPGPIPPRFECNGRKIRIAKTASPFGPVEDLRNELWSL